MDVFIHAFRVSRRHFIINIKFIWLKRNILTRSTDDNNTRRSLTHWSMQLNWSMEDESCYLLFFVLTLHDIILVENLAMNRHKNIVYCWKMKWFINKLQILFMISHHWIVSLFCITFSLKMCKLNVFFVVWTEKWKQLKVIELQISAVPTESWMTSVAVFVLHLIGH